MKFTNKKASPFGNAFLKVLKIKSSIFYLLLVKEPAGG